MARPKVKSFLPLASQGVGNDAATSSVGLGAGWLLVAGVLSCVYESHTVDVKLS